MKKVDDKKAFEILLKIVDSAMNVSITSDINFSEEHFGVLQNLNEYSLNHILEDPEIIRDPRKIPYKTNQELQTCLIALCLAQSLSNPLRKHKETKEFFLKNVIVESRNGEKFISFGDIDEDNVLEAIDIDLAEDWKIFRDRDGYGIISLVNHKTKLNGLDNYKAGGDVLYEFARFQRKYAEKQNKKEQEAKDSAQEAFRNAVAQTMAVEYTKQQMIEGKNPMEMLDLLFAPEKNKRKIEKLSNNNEDKSLEHKIKLLLTHDDK